MLDPRNFGDDRGIFSEIFKKTKIADSTGLVFEVKQVNQSRSKTGVIRGIHWATNPPGQMKYVMCNSGRIWDVVVDLRRNSPTFGQWEGIELSSMNGRILLLDSGLGHSFLALEANTTVTYLVSEEYNPEVEKSLNPLDPFLGIPFREVAAANGIREIHLSEKDRNAHSLNDCERLGII